MSIAEKQRIMSANNVTIADNEQKVYYAGKAKGIEEGKQAEYDEFWDAYQANGIATYYTHRFAGQGWNDVTFKPKYNIRVVGSADRMFRGTGYLNLRQRLLDCGVTMDTSKGTSFQYAFSHGRITELPKLDFSGTTTVDATLSGATELIYIEEMVVHENLKYSSPFNNCTSLVHLKVTGTIGQNGFDVHWSTQLSHDSLMSIINALKSGASNTITLGADNLTKLTDAEKAIATEKGWTLA